MERDLRRGQGEWKGCYTFKDIIASDQDQDLAKIRNGGLKMGATYYYYVSTSALHISSPSSYIVSCFPFPLPLPHRPSYFRFISFQPYVDGAFDPSALKSF
jgi:hypothetical protein